MVKHWEHVEYLSTDDYDSVLIGAEISPSVPLPYNTALYISADGRKRLECVYDGATKTIRLIKGKGPNRDLRLYKDALNNKNITVLAVDGLVGTGKTSTLMKHLIETNLKDVAISERNDMFSSVDGTEMKPSDRRMLIAKPAVNSSGEEYGFLPGNVNEKLTPTLKNYTQYFDRLHPAGFELLNEAGYVEILPLGFIRGMDADNIDVIVDEAQNTKELVTVATRHATDCRTFFLGDSSPFQIDKEGNDSNHNGLVDIIDLLSGAPYFQYIEMKSLEHIVRSEEVKDVMRRMFKKHGQNPREWIL